MTSWFSDARNGRPTVARRLQRTSSMRSTRVAFLLAAGLLTGCVGPGLYPSPFGGYAPGFGSGYYGSGYSPVYRSTSYYGGPYWHGNRYYGRSARELAADQARAQRALRHDQRERRDALRERQERHRWVRQTEGTWKRKNVRYQQQQRKNQRERFHDERQEQRKRQDRAWERN